MKKLAVFIILACFTYLTAFSQGCLPEGITFTTQAQIDSFQINYPGCMQIEGDVGIHEDDITNLNGLNILSEFGGYLSISQTGSLINLTGLDNVTVIGGDLILCWSSLIQLTGLESLSIIQGSLNLGFGIGPMGNPYLTNFTGLDNLTTIGGDLKILDNDSLISFDGLNSLSSINGDIKIRYNPSLTSLYGLGNLDANSINNLYINNNDTLLTCDIQSICDYLVSPNGIAEIYDNAIGCNSQEEIQETCEDTHCLPEGIIFSTQEQIDNFQVNHPNCVEIEGDVDISGDDIVNLIGLSEIISIGGGVTITGNYSLTSLAGFENLTTIEGSLTIGSLAYPLWTDNPLLNSLTGLEHLTNIGGNLEILCSSILSNLTGLDSLVSIGGYFSLGGNDSLTSLSGLDNLTTINGSLIIGLLAYEYWLPNPALTSLMGLENLGFIAGDVQIGGNESLSICEAEGICQYLINPNGDINIWDNAPGCNSPAEVIEACLVGIEDHTELFSLTIHPNPSENGSITINLENDLQNLHLTCFNTYGQQVLQQAVTGGTSMISVADWKSGIYLVVVYSDGKPVGRAKFIVQ